MYVEPGTNIRLLKNVPLNNDYKDTIYFSSSTAQANYFAGLAKYNLDDYSYQRVQRGWARIGIVADNLYDCNYMMFQNTNFGSKWFYAFITSVEYINNLVSEIHFEIDVLQTWHFDYSMMPCYIERQHTESDDLFEHFEPEPVEFGEMVTQAYNSGGLDWDDSFLVVCTPPLTDTTYPVQEVNGETSMSVYFTMANNTDTVQAFLNDVLSSTEVSSIISAYILPKVCYDGTPYDATTGEGSWYPTTNLSAMWNSGCSTPTFPTQLDGYTPKNNKMFSSPFVVCEVTDMCGNSTYYSPQYFSNLTAGGTAEFHSYAKIIGTPEIFTVPTYYKRETMNYSEGFLIGNFPQVSISNDTYLAWLAMNGSQIAINTVGAGVSAVTSIFSENWSGVVSAGLGIASNINSLIVNQNQPNSLVTYDSSGSMTLLRAKHPFFKWKVCQSDYAHMADDFFTRFGYAIGVIDTPNRNARPYWTYIKTRDCSIKGSVPADDMKTIRSIYDRGVTWWTSGGNVGNYELDNSPS